jgi:peroxiredoxin Q/BCP
MSESPSKLTEGQPAPEFTLPDAAGTPVSLSDYRGKHLVVFFYPAAMTPGCTKEACDFRDSLAPLQAPPAPDGASGWHTRYFTVQ